MKLLKIAWLLAMASSVLFASCKKDKTQEEEQLPPITQTGANTFGCLINGKIFVPQGFEQNKPNFSLVVDPTFQNGNFGITTFNKNLKIRFALGSNDIRSIGVFYINDTTKPMLVDVIDEVKNCSFNPSYFCISSSTCKVSGSLHITRYDLANNVFSGTFEFKLYNPNMGCDTFFITQGRFDKKL